MQVTAQELQIENAQQIIKAAENWSSDYKKDKDNFKKLLKLEARFETILRRYFREFSERVPSYIKWDLYYERLRQVAAKDDLSIDIMISDEMLGAEDQILIQAMYDPMAQAVALGAQAGESLYSIELGMSETSTVVQRTAKEMTAELVGKRVDDAGIIVDNPKSKYKISSQSRKAIRESISTSLSLGEDQRAATERLTKTIKNPKRAATIARTETVNGYQKGLLVMGQESGAVGKEWQSVNFDDVCGENDSQGIIKLNESFASGHPCPAAHPNCRCGMRLVYPEEIKLTKR